MEEIVKEPEDEIQEKIENDFKKRKGDLTSLILFSKLKFHISPERSHKKIIQFTIRV